MELDGFDANEVPPADAFEPLPVGWYTAWIIESEEKETKSGSGTYLQLTLEIQGGPYEGRKLWDRLNLNNPNATAVDIARRTLSAICHAVGVPNPKNSEDLHFKPLAVRVVMKKFEGEDKNEVKGYRAVGASGDAPKAPPKSATKPAEPAAKKPPPWQTKKAS